MKEYLYILTFGSISETLTVNPSGWDELQISYYRHKVYHSLLRCETLSLGFSNVTGGGYDFLLAAYETNGINTEVNIQIKKRNPLTNDYDAHFSGIINFAPDKFIHEVNKFIKAPIIDASILQKFISRDNNQLEMMALSSIDNDDITKLHTDEITLTPVNVVLKADASTSSTDTIIETIPFYQWGLTIADYLRKETDNLDVSISKTAYTNGTTATKSLTINLDYSYNYNLKIVTGANIIPVVFSFIIYHYRGATLINSKVTTLYSFIAPSSYDEQTFIIVSTTPIIISVNLPNVLPNDIMEAYTQVFFDTQAFFGWELTYNDATDFHLVETTLGKPASVVNCVKSFNIFEKALEIITGNHTPLTSTILDSGGDLEHVVAMSGRMIRKYPNAIMSLSFRDLFKSFDSVWNLMLGFDKGNNKFIMESKQAAFDGENYLFDLGDVLDLTIKPMVDGYFSRVIGGFKTPPAYERAQGAYEFGVIREYSSNAIVKEEKNIQSVYRFDSLGIEDLRNLPYVSLSSTDNQGDNELFIVKATAAMQPHFPDIADFPVDAIGHEIFASYYNLNLTPRQNALRWGNILKAGAYKNTIPLKSQKVDRQFDLVIYGKNENSSIEISELDTALFIPEILTFSKYLTDEQITMIDLNPNGVVQLRFEGKQYEGFIDTITTGDYNKESTFELIRKDLSETRFIFEDDNRFAFEDDNKKIFE